MLNTNNKLKVADLPNNRARKRAWMREGQWLWHLIHTDTFANTKPVFGTLEKMVKLAFSISMGCNSNSTRPQGPPTGATTNA